MMAADFGSGSGGWAIPLAKKLKMGRVYAVDIQPEALEALKSKAEMAKVFNIKTVKADLEESAGSSIQTGLLDLVLATNLFFQAKNKKAILVEAKRVLKTNGQLLVVDWQPETSLGPVEGRVSAQEIQTLAESLGFKLEKQIEAGPYHWALLLREI